MSKKVAFLTLGCKLNYAETSTYHRGFTAAGWETVPWREKADVYVINTCTVTATADTKSRNLVRKVHRINPDAAIIVTGCSAELRRPDFESIEGVTRVFGATEKQYVVDWCVASQPGGVPREESQESAIFAESQKFPISSDPTIPLRCIIPPLPCRGRHVLAEDTSRLSATHQEPSREVFAAYSSGERTRSFLKVQDGCDNFCKYCTVPYARGRSRNVPIGECVRLAKEIAAQGIKEIVLTGVNTGDFGRTTGESFLDLLKALEAVEGIERYRISSIEPNLLTDEIIDWTAASHKFQPHFHIPLQTGCDSQLERMGRHYDTAFFAAKLDRVRKAFAREGRSPVFFGIDVMVGLPGETPELFGQTRDFIESVEPAFIHVFPYSRRPGTPAAAMPGQVTEAEKARRVAVLEELCSQLHSKFAADCSGLREKVLWESTCRGGTMEGYTGNYIRVERPYDPTRVNTIEEITI